MSQILWLASLKFLLTSIYKLSGAIKVIWQDTRDIMTCPKSITLSDTMRSFDQKFHIILSAFVL
ncbi:CLUMA_CG000413, isoform A [Clunio marinus]|uniref:CLUMA_CG000413, isoform A n=1 Tax=Clunio marinus TaxID=568069 RepID=A0A1J1HFH6_9DIPT|nr:CLUMA_CG000413, isoform A [Clunio marinus]